MLRDSIFFMDEMKTHTYCNKKWVELRGSTFELPSETMETSGAHDYKICSKCIDNHKRIYEGAKVSFEKFPFCCDEHTKLSTKKWFDKKAFGDVPLQYANKIIFTTQHIKNFIENEDWYKEITDYIDYTVLSFGQMPKDCGEPFFVSSYLKDVREYLKNRKKDNAGKTTRIIDYINSYFNPEENRKIELNVLLSIYQTWLNIFPFEISYFKDLRQKFERDIPLLAAKPEYNKYAGLSKVKMQTKSGLIKVLVSKTKELLGKIDASELLRKNAINDTKVHTYELISESHRIKQLSLLGDYSIGEKEYIELVQNWLSNEKNFFSEILPFISGDSSKSAPSSVEETEDFLLSNIEDWLQEFEERMSKSDYKLLKELLQAYFRNGAFPKLTNRIHVAKVNKKKFGWALSQIYRSQKDIPLSLEYLRFAKENITLFSDVEFNADDHKNCLLYKYFTTKT